MANRKLTELPEITDLNFDSGDLLYIVDSAGNGTSSRITYGNLAGTKINTISTNFIAYDNLNTLNLNFLSGRIENNETDIATLDGGAASAGTKFDLLSTTVGNLSSDVIADIANLEAEIASTLQSTAFVNLTTNVENLSNNQDFLENSLIFGKAGMSDQPSIINQGGIGNNADYFTFDGTISGQAIFDESKITQLGSVSASGAGNAAAITTNSTNIGTNTTAIAENTIDIANIRTLSGFNGTVTSGAPVSGTKHVNIVIGTTTYKLLLAD